MSNLILVAGAPRGACPARLALKFSPAARRLEPRCGAILSGLRWTNGVDRWLDAGHLGVWSSGLRRLEPRCGAIRVPGLRRSENFWSVCARIFGQSRTARARQVRARMQGTSRSDMDAGMLLQEFDHGKNRKDN